MRKRTSLRLLNPPKRFVSVSFGMRSLVLGLAVFAAPWRGDAQGTSRPSEPSPLQNLRPVNSFTAYTEEQQAGVASLSELEPIPQQSSASFYDPSRNYYLWVRHLAGQQLGDSHAYTGVGGTRFVWLEDGSVFLLSGQALVTNEGRPGGNLGLMYRTSVMGDTVLGAGYWYDVKQSDYKNTYQQWGPSFELLRDDWRIRANGYIPFNTDSNVVSTTTIGVPGATSYWQNYLIYDSQTTELREVALKGFDVEIARSLDLVGLPFIEVHGSYYRFENLGTEVSGGRGGFRGWLTRNLFAEINLSDDELFGTNVFGGITWYFDFGGEGRFNESSGGTACPVKDFLTVPVRRNEQVVVREETNVSGAYTVLTQSGSAIQIVHVDGADGGGGLNNGTYENPLSSVNDVFANSATGNIVLVHGGTTYTNQAVVLQDDQRLVGEGLVTLSGGATAQFPTVTTDQLGVINLPETATGASALTAPTITNDTGSAIVTLGTSGNGISGLHLVGGNSAGTGIMHGGSGATDTTINYVSITDFSATGGYGVNIAPSVNTTITNFDINNNDTNIFLNATNSTITDGSVNTGRYGIRLGSTTNGISGTATIARVDIDDIDNEAILLNSATAGSTTTITDVTIDGGTGNGLRVVDSQAGATFDVNNLDIGSTTAVGGGGVIIEGTGSGTFDFDGTSTITNPGGIAFQVDGGSPVVTVNGPITNNANRAIDIQNMTGGSVDFNGLITETGTGVFMDNNTGATFSYDGGLVINTISGSPGFTATNGGTVNVTGAANTIATTSARAVDLQNVAIGASGVSFATITANNAAAAFEGVLADTVTGTGAFTSTTTTVTGTSGVGVAGVRIADSTPTFNLGTVIVNNTTGDGIEITGATDVNVTTVGIDNTTGNGISISGTTSAIVSGGTVNDAAADGINITDSNVTLSNLLLTNAANTMQDGIEVTSTDTSRTFTLQNTTIDSTDRPNEQGLDIHVNGSGTLTVNVDNNVLNGTGHAVNVDEAAGATGNSVLNLQAIVASSENAAGINLDGSAGTGTMYVTNFNGMTVTETTGGAGGILTDTVTFDATPGGTIQQVNGGTVNIGSGTAATQRVQGDGLRFDSPSGDLAFTTINIYNNNGTGLLVDTKSDGTTFNLVNGGGTIDTTNGAAMNLDPLTADLTFGSVTATGGTNGIVLDTVGNDPNGSGNALVIANTTITDTTSTAISVQNSPGVQVDFGTTSIADVTPYSGDGINLSNNAGASFQFTQLDIATANGAGLVANDSGRVDVTNATASSINATGGAVLDVTGTILSSGGVTGIPFATLASTDSSGAGLSLADEPTGTYSFENVNLVITNPAGHGIEASNIGNLILKGPNVVITDAGEDGVNITNSDATIDGITITDPGDDGIQITNQTDTHTFTIRNLNLATAGDDGIIVANSSSGTLTGTIENNTINARGDGIVATNTSAGTFDLTVNDNTIVATTGDGFAATNDSTGTQFTIDLNRNTITAANGTGIQIGDTITGTSTGTTIGLNFTGSSLYDSGYIPPDTMGAVGPNHVVELLNGRFAVYDKTTGNLLASSTLDEFWTNAGAAFTGYTFDPRLIYDSSSGRWFAAAVDNGGNANNFLIAVSDSSDPTSGWTGFAIDSDTDDVQWADFDTMGIDADGLYLVANMFPVATGSDEVNLLSIPKADLLRATPTVANATLIEDLSAQGIGFAVQPAVDFGTSDGSAALLATSSGSSSTLYRTDVLNAGTSSATVSSTTNISVASYTNPPTADQPGTAQNLNTGDARLSGNVVEVGGSLWAVQCVTDSATGNAAVRWYEIDEATNAVLQSGTISDANLDFYFPSIAVNSSGDVVIGFSGSGDSQFVSSYAAVGTTTGGATTFNTPMVLQTGMADYEILDGISRNRWGDYSATVVDPTDSTRFWTFQEVTTATDTWGVQITELRMTQQDTQTVTGGEITITGFDSNVVNQASDRGMSLNNVTFDSDLNTAGYQTVTGGATRIGEWNTAGNPTDRVTGDGLSIVAPTGSLSFTDLDIANESGTGLLVDASTTTTDFSLTVAGTSKVNTTNGRAINIDRATVNTTFERVDSNGADDGVHLNDADGTFAITGTGTTAGSGGFLQGTTNSITVAGSLNGTGTNVALANVSLNGNASVAGVNATNVASLNVDNSILNSTLAGWVGVKVYQDRVVTGISPVIDIDGNTFNGTGTDNAAIQVQNLNTNGLGGSLSANFTDNTAVLTGSGTPIFLDLDATWTGADMTISGTGNAATSDGATPLATGNKTNGVDSSNTNGAGINGLLEVNSINITFP